MTIKVILFLLGVDKKQSSRLVQASKPQPTMLTRAKNACILCRVARRKSRQRVNLLGVNEDFEDKRNTEIYFLVTPFFVGMNKKMWFKACVA